MTRNKYLRMREEYDGQCERLEAYQKAFRKIGRTQIEKRALRRKESSNVQENADGLVKRGVKSLNITPELCGLLRKINNTRRMLFMPETTGCKLLR